MRTWARPRSEPYLAWAASRLMPKGCCRPPEMEEVDIVSCMQEEQIALPVVNSPLQRHRIPALGIPNTVIDK